MNFKKIIAIIVIILALALIVSAENPNYDSSITFSSVVENNKPADNFIGRIVSKLNYEKQDFSVYGDELGCSVTPDDRMFFTYGDTATFIAYGDNAAFVNWFRGSPFDGAYPSHPTDSRQFMTEEYITANNPSSFTCDAGAYWSNECYGEIYHCTEPVCYADSDCNRASLPLEICDKSIISLKIPNAGVCEETEGYLHTTTVYLCEGGKVIDQYEVSDGSLEFCKDQTTSRYYLLDSNVDQCLSYTPFDCTDYVEPTCGDSVCDSDEDCNNCVGDCGECPEETSNDCQNKRTDSDTDCDGIISPLEVRRSIGEWKEGNIDRNALGVILEAWGQDNE